MATPSVATAPITFKPATEAALVVAGTGFMAGVGALGAWLISVNPLAGAVFGATHNVASYATSKLIENTGWNPENQILKVAKFALPIIVSVGAAIGSCIGAGFALSAKTFTLLALSMYAISFIAIPVLGIGGGIGLMLYFGPEKLKEKYGQLVHGLL